MDRSNEIHPTAILEGGVHLGRNNRIGPYCVLYGPLTIGDDNLIGPHVVIGSPGADTRNPRYDSASCQIVIGDRNILREFSAVQKPCYRDLTQIGNDVHVMAGVHVQHDAILEDGVVITAMCALAGISRIMTCAYLGMGCTITQYTVVGPYSIVATGAPVIKNVRPFSRYIPGKPASVNHYALKKFGFAQHAEEIERYLLQGVEPVHPEVQAVVAGYHQFHVESGREQYV